MKIIKAYPPNFAEISRVFPVKGRQGLLYAWGETLYNPSGVTVPSWLMAHEEVHGRRQHSQAPLPQDWWDRYLRSSTFRLQEEILAHRAEWQSYKSYQRRALDGAEYLEKIAERLASPLYGSMISVERAKKEILNEGLSIA